MPFRHWPEKHIVAVVFVVGVFMDILDTTVVNVALPALKDHFHVGTTTIEWVVTGYLLSLAIWIPASGWIGDRFGTKRTFLFALGMFTAASAMCGTAWNASSLIAFRILQGIGGGMLVPVGTAMLFRAYPPAERAKASSVLAVPTVLAPALGPVLGGLLVTHASWRWIFYLNLPLGAAGFAFGFFFLMEHRESAAGRFDVPGFVLSGAGLALILFALAEAPKRGWGSSLVVLTGGAGLALFAVLVFVELRQPEPMLYLQLFRDRLFRQANVCSLLAAGSLFGLIFLLPLFLQDPGLRGLTAFRSGLTTFPQALGVMTMVRLVGRIYPRVGPRRLLMGGMLGTSLVSLAFVRVDVGTSLWWIRLLMYARGCSMAFAFIPLQAATFATVSPSDTGRASSLYNALRQMGAALGVASLATILTTRLHANIARLGDPARAGALALRNAKVTAFHEAMVASGLFTLIGIASAFFLRDEDAAATMQPRAVALVE
jgi:EmrB/QacA subfamily drug resistance transporter